MTTRNHDNFTEDTLMFHYVSRCHSYYTRSAWDMAQRITREYDPDTGWSGVFMDQVVAHRNWNISGETYTMDDATRDLKTVMASGYWEMEESEDGSLWFRLKKHEHQRMLNFDAAVGRDNYKSFERHMLTPNSPDRYRNQRKWAKKNKKKNLLLK